MIYEPKACDTTEDRMRAYYENQEWKKQVKLLISYWSELFFIQRVNILRGFFALNKCRCYQVDSASLNKGALGHQQIYKPMSTYSCHFNSNSQIFSHCNFASIFGSFRSTSFFCLVSCYVVKILTTVCSTSTAFFYCTCRRLCPQGFWYCRRPFAVLSRSPGDWDARSVIWLQWTGGWLQFGPCSSPQLISWLLAAELAMPILTTSLNH